MTYKLYVDLLYLLLLNFQKRKVENLLETLNAINHMGHLKLWRICIVMKMSSRSKRFDCFQ
jgi:hypothetical protein